MSPRCCQWELGCGVYAFPGTQDALLVPGRSDLWSHRFLQELSLAAPAPVHYLQALHEMQQPVDGPFSWDPTRLETVVALGGIRSLGSPRLPRSRGVGRGP